MKLIFTDTKKGFQKENNTISQNMIKPSKINTCKFLYS